MCKLLFTVRGLIVACLLILNLIIVSSLTLIFGFIAWINPIHPWRRAGLFFANQIPNMWMTINRGILWLSAHGKWDIQSDCRLQKKGTYMLISNHRSWFDILVLGCVFNNKIPSFKFFMKKELLWSLPIAGLACYFLGYPFMERHTRAQIRKNPELKGKDILTTKKACEKFKLIPTTVINFVEGTRLTEDKHTRQQSPFQHLLKPKAGGTAVVINELKDNLTAIIDATIAYHIEKFSFWNFICGNFTKISVRYECLPVSNELLGDYYGNREFRAQFQNWLNHRWQLKDELIGKLLTKTK